MSEKRNLNGGGGARETTYVSNAMRQNEVFEKKFQQSIPTFDRNRNVQIVNDEFKIWDVRLNNNGKFNRSRVMTFYKEPEMRDQNQKSIDHRILRQGQKRYRPPLSYRKLEKLSELSYKCPEIDNVEFYAKAKTLTHVMALAERNQKLMNKANKEKENNKKASKIYTLRNQTLPFPLMKPSLTPEDVQKNQRDKPENLVKFKPILTRKLAKEDHELKLRRIDLKKVGLVEKLKEDFVKDAMENRERTRSHVTDQKVILEFHDCKRMEFRGIDPVKLKMEKLEADMGIHPNAGGSRKNFTRVSTFRGLVRHVMNIMRWTRALSLNRTAEIRWEAVRKKMPFRFDRHSASNRRQLEGEGELEESKVLDYIEDQPCLDSMRHCRTVRFSSNQNALVKASLEREPFGSHSDFLVLKRTVAPIYTNDEKRLHSLMYSSIGGISSNKSNTASFEVHDQSQSSFLPPIMGTTR